MSPAALFLSSHTALASHRPELSAIVIGIFLHVSTTILFEVEEGHRFNFRKGLAVLAGLGAGVLTLVLH